MNKTQAENLFKYHYPEYKDLDKVAQRELWSYFTDDLCKDGEITTKQYENWMYPSYFKK